MSEYAIDSSVWIAYLEGREDVRGFIEEQSLRTCAIAIAEVAGSVLHSGSDPTADVEFIRTVARVVPVDDRIAERASLLQERQRKRRPKFGLADAIHYESAGDATFLTLDHDFAGLKGVKVLSRG